MVKKKRGAEACPFILGWLRTMRELEAADVVAGRSVRGAAEKSGVIACRSVD